MSKKEIILIGGGGHCKSCIDVIESTDEYIIAGIIDTPNKIGEEILGYKVIGCDEDLKELSEIYKYAFITVGQIKSASIRKKLFIKAKEVGFSFPIIVASTAYVSKHSTIEEGTIIMHQAMINANVKIGRNNIINTKVLIEHDTVIGDFNHISTGSILNGDVSVGNECFIGSNSTLSNGVILSSNVIISIGSTTTKSIKASGVYFCNKLKAKSIKY